MLTIFKKLFRKSEPAAAAPAARAAQPSEPAAPMPSVEVAHLSLPAIIARFSDDLKATVLRAPDPSATISLPLPLIYKQLASGSVKMSLASLHRQAPHGVFGPLAPGDKRQVEIPLQEIFRHVKPQALKRRVDQRPLDDPDNEFNLFGNAENPYEIAPTTPENPPRRDSTVLDLTPAPSSRIRPPENGTPSVPPARLSGIAPPSGMRMISPPAMEVNGSHESVSRPHPAGPPLTLPLSAIAIGWPAEICGEITGLDPQTSVTLDGGVVAAGLAKGRVTFTWGEIRNSLDPLPAEPTAVDESTVLPIPLKIVAPAFLAASKNGKSGRKSVEIDETIPALFSDGREPAPASPAPDPAMPPESLSKTEPGQPIHLELKDEVAPHDPSHVPTTVGEVFGQPQKVDFTPAEIVAGTMKLPGVAGAIVALQEGLQVAASLPEGIKSEVVAAFLPQIFARLNQYSGEMRMGEVDDLLFTTHGAHCQIYRLGFVYFAVLGQPGEALPWNELRLIAAELGRQTNQ